MRIAEVALKCVVFIGLPRGDDLAVKPILGGTGFFVDVPSADRRFYTTYLVTARHIAEKIEGRVAIVRMNAAGGGLLHFRIKPEIRWWRHPETPDLVDAAVIPWKPGLVADYKVLRPDEWFLTEKIIKDRDLGPADEVFLVGLFTRMSGEQKNIPIVRSGNIAMMPDEMVPGITGPHGESVTSDAYLIELRSIGGISGSPVFIRETLNLGIVEDATQKPAKIHGLGSPYFLGLAHGHWSIPPENRNDADIQTIGDKKDRINVGIAVVVPAKKILEVLNHPELIQMRKEAEEKTLREAGTEQDFAEPEPKA